MNQAAIVLNCLLLSEFVLDLSDSLGLRGKRSSIGVSPVCFESTDFAQFIEVQLAQSGSLGYPVFLYCKNHSLEQEDSMLFWSDPISPISRPLGLFLCGRPHMAKAH